jgi:hypothetical protein
MAIIRSLSLCSYHEDGEYPLLVPPSHLEDGNYLLLMPSSQLEDRDYSLFIPSSQLEDHYNLKMEIMYKAYIKHKVFISLYAVYR